MESIILDIISRIEQFCKKHKKIAVLIVLSSFTGITLFGQVNFYPIWASENAYVEPTDSQIHIAPTFSRGTRHIRFIIPILYSYRTYDSPYTYQFGIAGIFDSIKNVQAKFVINNSETINIPITDEELNSTREKAYSFNGNVFFSNKKILQVQAKDGTCGILDLSDTGKLV